MGASKDESSLPDAIAALDGTAAGPDAGVTGFGLSVTRANRLGFSDGASPAAELARQRLDLPHATGMSSG